MDFTTHFVIAFENLDPSVEMTLLVAFKHNGSRYPNNGEFIALLPKHTLADASELRACRLPDFPFPSVDSIELVFEQTERDRSKPRPMELPRNTLLIRYAELIHSNGIRFKAVQDRIYDLRYCTLLELAPTHKELHRVDPDKYRLPDPPVKASSKISTAIDPYDAPVYSGTRLWTYSGSVVDEPLGDDAYHVDQGLNGSGDIYGSTAPGSSETACVLNFDIRRYGNVGAYASVIITYDRPVPPGYDRITWRFDGSGDSSRAEGNLEWELFVVNFYRRETILHKSHFESGRGRFVVPDWGDRNRIVTAGDTIRFLFRASVSTSSTSMGNYYSYMTVNTDY